MKQLSLVIEVSYSLVIASDFNEAMTTVFECVGLFIGENINAFSSQGHQKSALSTIENLIVSVNLAVS